MIHLFLQVFLEPLKEIQQMGHLQHVDVNKIFCNVQDLCEVIQVDHLVNTTATTTTPFEWPLRVKSFQT